MVIGNGLLAKRFGDYSNNAAIVIFASGVSNSGNTSASEFQREKNLLQQVIENNPGKTIVYFSTCSIYDAALADSAYVRHKLSMEKLVQSHRSPYHIFRISNLAGKTDNPNTVLNYFAQHIVSGSHFFLWEKSSRNIIDIDDAYSICDYIISKNLFPGNIVNVANPANYPVKNIIAELESHFRQEGNYTPLSKESNPVIDTSAIAGIIAELNINFDAGYLQRTIEKYFPAR